ncbi:MAG TPA: DUF3105 domain-containing protein [Actinomycetota bacterium]|nr:DUF3105 domain-containing protein [Actinomycetota bacterium]
MAKKKSRKKARPAGYDPNEARRQRLEARRKAREEEARKKAQAQRRERWIRRGALVLLFVGVFWFIAVRGGRPDAIAGNDLDLFSETVSQPNHVSTTVNYPMTPPVAGQHSASTIPCGTYAQTPPNEQFVHALEHGAVGILYNPAEVPPEDIADIEELVGEYDSHVLSAPFPNMDESPIAVTSWGEMMRLNSWDPDAAAEYIRVFRQKGPEKQPCQMASDDSFEPEPEETPEAEETPPEGEETPGSADAEADDDGGGNNGGGGSGGNNNGGG